MLQVNTLENTGLKKKKKKKKKKKEKVSLLPKTSDH
jgi:hypothetical protein